MLTLLLACNPPPPAPEGLDDSTSYMVREFYSDDATFQAGVQGFLAWFDEEGHELVGVGADGSNTDSFSVGVLTDEDVARLPLADQVLIDGENDVWEDRDVGAAKGVVSLAEMDCDYLTAEDFLVRPDQDNVFSGDWEGYDRTYVTSQEDFKAASRDGEFDLIETALDPFAGDFDATATARTVLFTSNEADPSQVLFADLQSYELLLDLRHGRYDIDGVDTPAFAILTYNTDAVWDDEGKNGLVQSYSIEINVSTTEDTTLRMLAVWAQPVGGGLEPDDPLVLNYAVNKSLGSSERLSAVCSGEEEVE